jgi:hypothetical protein
MTPDYPKPPFPAQKQSMPGSTEAMQPRPITARPATGKLKGMRAIITGGDSGIGRAVAIAYAREGADVLIAFLSETEEAAEVKKLVEKEESRERFLTELTLDPPDATSNQAGVPLLMRITSFCPASIPPTVQAVETFFISQKLHDPPGRNRTKIWPTGLRPCPDSLVLFLPVQSSQIAEPADGQSIEIVHAFIG